MKIVALAILVIVVGCSTPQQQAAPGMAGAYSMLSQSFKDTATDTTITQYRQLKIYTGDYMMYVLLNPADSVSAFGVGTYIFDSGKLKENIIYSAADNTENTSPFASTVNITKTGGGYQQVIPGFAGDKGKVRLTEEYQSAGTATTSPLDGVWQQVSGYTIRSKDTVVWTDVQYKSFYAGNFAFGNVSPAAGNTKQAGISYGTFTMQGDTLVKETIVNSTWPALKGQTFNVHVTINAAGTFTQTNINPNGEKEVITYQKMKK